MVNHTKIICTIGPACDTLEKMVAMIEAGMNVARINLSHGNHEMHQKTIENLKKARETCGVPLSIMLDTKGPEIRVGDIQGDLLDLTLGQTLKIVRKPRAANEITINPFNVIETLSVGMKVLFDDGYIISEIIEKNDEEITLKLHNSGVLKSHKGVNIPDAKLNLPAMTDKDIEDLRFGCDQDVDIIAASFIRSADHVLAIKEFLAKNKKPEILVIAKIENAEGVHHFDSIVQAADGIMIARGDLGVELDLSTVPKLQKMMIRKCYHACKPSVIATQMLESMITNPRPTRAEVSDVANAIYDSASSVMLSGETAVGAYPIQAVKQMRKIVEFAENDFDYRDFFDQHTRRTYHDISSSVALAAVKTAYSSGARAIFAYTSSGFTARLVSRLRPGIPIIALTQNKKNYYQLGFNWGVIPIFIESCKNAREAFNITSQHALELGIITFGDQVVVTAGSPFGKAGSTNMMIVENIGDILVRGHRGIGSKTEGKVAIVLSPEGKDPSSTDGCIMVVPRCDTSFLPLLKGAKGLILQNHIDDTISEKYAVIVAKTFDIPVITRADGALVHLRNQEVITMDPQRGIVYQGSIEKNQHTFKKS